MPSPADPRADIRRRAADAGIDLPDGTVDELAQHLGDVYDDAIDDGATNEEADRRMRAALDESAFDDFTRHAARGAARGRAQARAWAAPPMSGRSWNVIPALRLALRQFRTTPSFTAVTVLVLGLGIGAATTVFSVVDAVVLRPLPFAQPDALVTLWDANTAKGVAHEPISPVTFMDYRALPVFAGAAAWWRPGINLVDPGQDPIRVNTIEVSGNLFDVLGVGPQIGAGFPAGGPLHANELIAVISDRLWRSRYSADPTIIGRPLSFNGTPYAIVGVMPAGFHFPDDVDVWQRLRWDMTQHSREAHFMEAVLRLADDTTLAQAQSAADALAARLGREFSSSNGGWRGRLVPLLDEQLGYYRPALLVLFGAVALLLAIAVLNVASLLLARAVGRGREMAVRVALGGAPRHIITQLLAEGVVLSVAGVLAGVLASAFVLPLLIRALPVSVPRLADATLDPQALAVSLCIGVVATLVFGVVPALMLLRSPVSADMKAAERGSSRRGRRLYSGLVAAEVAMAGALLVSSALLVRSVRAMVDEPVGGVADDVVTTTVQVRPAGQRSGRGLREAWMDVATTHAQLLDEVRSQPGVMAAGSSNFLPLTVGWRNPVAIDGQPMPARQEDLPQVQMHSVSDGYFEAMGVAMAAGRAFTAFDGPESAAVAIVNAAFVRRHLAGGRAVGTRLRMWSSGIGPLGVNLMTRGPIDHDGVRFEVVGVVGDVTNGPLGQPVESAVYFTTRQFPFSEVFIAVSATSTAAAVGAVQQGLRRVASDVPMGLPLRWSERFAARTAEARLLMSVLLVFGAVAAVLAALGVYGLFSWSVAMRTRELAIRLTLGAAPASVGGAVMRQAATLVAIGLAVGLVMVRLSEAAMTRVLYGVSTSDAPALISAATVLVLAAVSACAPAALRAMRVDPAIGLRVE